MASPGCEWRSVAAPVQWPPTTGVPGPVRIEPARIWCCYVEQLLSALALFVARVVLADDHHVAIAADDAAVLAHGLDAGGDLHFVSSFAVFVLVR